VVLELEQEATRRDPIPGAEDPIVVLGGALEGVVPETRARIRVSGVEDVIAQLSNDERCPAPLRAYARRLKARYLLP